MGVVGLSTELIHTNTNDLGRSTAGGESPVVAGVDRGESILSRGGPVKSPLNRPAPSGKAKYDQNTDSAEYREGKVKSTGSTRVK